MTVSHKECAALREKGEQVAKQDRHDLREQATKRLCMIDDRQVSMHDKFDKMMIQLTINDEKTAQLLDQMKANAKQIDKKVSSDMFKWVVSAGGFMIAVFMLWLSWFSVKVINQGEVQVSQGMVLETISEILINLQ